MCQSVHNNDEDAAVCQRAALAGLSLAKVFRDVMKLKWHLSFKQRDKRRVKKTKDGHPFPQCRLDTYFQGALCNRGYEEETSPYDP